jgi:hypothetical protein
MGQKQLLKEVEKTQPKYAEYVQLVFKGLFDTLFV